MGGSSKRCRSRRVSTTGSAGTTGLSAAGSHAAMIGRARVAAELRGAADALRPVAKVISSLHG
jgi:hypothetical protein